MSSESPNQDVSEQYCPRFGQIAVELGFITGEQLKEALACQVHEELTGRGHRLIGTILFEKKWMSGPQIELVLNTLFRRLRKEGMADGG